MVFGLFKADVLPPETWRVEIREAPVTEVARKGLSPSLGQPIAEYELSEGETFRIGASTPYLTLPLSDDMSDGHAQDHPLIAMVDTGATMSIERRDDAPVLRVNETTLTGYERARDGAVTYTRPNTRTDSYDFPLAKVRKPSVAGTISALRSDETAPDTRRFVVVSPDTA